MNVTVEVGVDACGGKLTVEDINLRYGFVQTEGQRAYGRDRESNDLRCELELNLDDGSRR